MSLQTFGKAHSVTESPLALGEDRSLSPLTGWTRDHWVAAADQLLGTARRYGTPSHARIYFPGAEGGYGRAVDGLEGFARTFLAAGFLIVGNGGHDPANYLGWYAEGLAAGVDPTHPERWVRPSEHGQAKVEAASLALVLHLTKPWLWDKLSSRVQEQTVEYFSEWIGADYPPNNWVWFQIVTEQFLKNVGGPHSEDDIETGLAFHESLFREDGWYSDGATRNFDHYVGWALHVYPLLWTQMVGPDADALRVSYQQRLDRYVSDAIRLVGADGGPLAEGRSLIYRFATLAPLWMGALTGSPTAAPGRIRRAASGTLRHFAEHGAPNDDGVLNMGWFNEFRLMAQSYSGPGSPYWASKGLLGLMAPATHPVWTDIEEPLPLEVTDDLRVVKSPGWIVSGTKADGIVRVLNHGTDHATPGDMRGDAALYARAGYSTATMPALAGIGAIEPVDNVIALLDESGRLSSRTGLETLLLEVIVGDRGDDVASGAATSSPGPVANEVAVAFSRVRAHWVEPADLDYDHGGPVEGAVTLGPWLTTGSVAKGPWEIRLGRVDGIRRDGGAGVNGSSDLPDAAGSSCGHVMRFSGWPLSGDTPCEASESTTTNAALLSEVRDVVGLPVSGTMRCQDVSPLGPETAIPWRSTDGHARFGEWYVALVRLAGNTESAASAAVPTVSLEAQSRLRVAWPDGVLSSLRLPEVI